jgi:hypothetical protein
MKKKPEIEQKQEQSKDNAPVIEKTKHKLFIPNSMMNHINQLHREIGPIEWSGILLFEHNGSIEEGLDLKAKGLYPMNIGHATYTEFSSGKKMQDIEKLHETWEDEDWRCALVHTHHSMPAFASTTDIKEIEDNANLHEYYVSLIVNFSGQFVCKIGIYSEEVQTVERYRIHPMSGTKEFAGTSKREYKKVEIVDCEIIYEDNKVLSKVIKELKDSKKASEVKTFATTSNKYGDSFKYGSKDWNWDQWKNNNQQTSLFGDTTSITKNIDYEYIYENILEILCLDSDLASELTEEFNANMMKPRATEKEVVLGISMIEKRISPILTMKSIKEVVYDICLYHIDLSIEDFDDILSLLKKSSDVYKIFEKVREYLEEELREIEEIKRLNGLQGQI